MNAVTGNLGCSGCLIAPFLPLIHLFMHKPQPGDVFTRQSENPYMLEYARLVRPCGAGREWFEWRATDPMPPNADTEEFICYPYNEGWTYSALLSKQG